MKAPDPGGRICKPQLQPQKCGASCPATREVAGSESHYKTSILGGKISSSSGSTSKIRHPPAKPGESPRLAVGVQCAPTSFSRRWQWAHGSLITARYGAGRTGPVARRRPLTIMKTVTQGGEPSARVVRTKAIVGIAVLGIASEPPSAIGADSESGGPQKRVAATSLPTTRRHRVTETSFSDRHKV